MMNDSLKRTEISLENRSKFLFLHPISQPIGRNKPVDHGSWPMEREPFHREESLVERVFSLAELEEKPSKEKRGRLQIPSREE